jgi:hypothetical protein
VAVDALVVSKKLRQVLGTSVGDRPLEFSWVPSWALRLIFRLSCCFCLFLPILVQNFLFLFNYFWLREFFPLVISESSLLGCVLKTDNSRNLSNVLFDLEHLVHVSQG